MIEQNKQHSLYKQLSVGPENILSPFTTIHCGGLTMSLTKGIELHRFLWLSEHKVKVE